MSINNYFVKLLVISSNNDFFLLYGFCSVTTQETYSWRQDKVKRTNRSIWKAILSEDECKDFLDKLTKPITIVLNKNNFTSPQLKERQIVLSNDGSNESAGPIKECRYLTEFWNVNKKELFNNVLECIGTDGKALYKNTKELFDWVSKECGINFFENGHRFGNFEYYHQAVYKNDFIVESHKEYSLRKTTVTKQCEFNHKLIVNCVSEHRDRIICNQTKIFQPEKQVLEFTAEEPMSKVNIQIWDETSGNLIFSYNGTLLMGIHIDMNFGSPLYQVKDPWSHKLLKTASNRSKIIKEQIETVSFEKKYDGIFIESEFCNEIDTAIEEGHKIFASYSQSEAQGAFIKNMQKDGEINSFLKIREYIEQSSVKRVIIADPYFSCLAAEKVLARISRSDMQVEVITSLSDINPDTGEVTKSNEDARLKNFLEDNANILHPNLLVCNLKRGGKQVFHDRYLLRYFDDGKIDGFLLSNSLNSMGQFYPFVIAPLEYEVCLEVSSYLEEMRDTNIQSNVNKKERILCDVLYDSKNRKQICQREQSEALFSDKWMEQWCNADKELNIPEQDIPKAVSVVMDHWNEDKYLACRSLCSISATITSYSFDGLVYTIRKIDGLAEMFLKVFATLAREKESLRDHTKKGIESEEHKIWVLLNGKAQPSKSGFSKIIDHAGHIWYEDGWMRPGYKIMFWLEPKCFMELLESTKSPMMFDVLIYQLLNYNWSDDVFSMVIENGSLYAQIICADCLLQGMKMKKLAVKKCKAIWKQLSTEKRAIQMARVLSETTFYVRTVANSWSEQESERWRQLCDWLMSSLATDIINCTQEEQETVLDWLGDCEAKSNCKLYLTLADKVSDSSIKIKLLDKAINIVQKELLDYSYGRDMGEIILLYLQGIDIRYGHESEDVMFKQVVSQSVFATASEPELKNYEYDRWHKATIGAQRQIQLLRGYLKNHPDSVKAKQYLEQWEGRI